MPGFLSDARENYFWNNWKDRFMNSHQRYIDPNGREVVRYAESLNIDTKQYDEEIAVDLWKHVDNSYGYNLTKEWKEPSKTIRDRVGDCEDFVFLMASLLPNLGVNKFDIVAGDSIAGDRSEFHTWLRVSDRIIDPTTGPNEMDGLRYVEKHSFTVEVVE